MTYRRGGGPDRATPPYQCDDKVVDLGPRVEARRVEAELRVELDALEARVELDVVFVRGARGLVAFGASATLAELARAVVGEGKQL